LDKVQDHGSEQDKNEKQRSNGKTDNILAL
jgi:hypothetical protein